MKELYEDNFKSEMTSSIVDDLMVVLLSIPATVFADMPVLLLALAGLLLIVITAEAMEFKVGPLKIVAVLGYALCGGNIFSFAAIALVDKIKVIYRIAGAYALFIAWTFLYGRLGGSGVSGQDMALAFLWGLVLVAIETVFLLVKYLIKKTENKIQKDKDKIRNLNISELHEKQLNRELAKQNYLAERNARLIERENISRNIHNSVGHSITAAIMTLDAADMLYDVKPEEARIRMNDATERIRGSLDSIRRAVRTLDAEGAPISVSDLLGDMNGILDEFVLDSKRQVDRLFPIEQTDILIPHEHAEFLTGVLEELLTNGVKHGKADKFVIMLEGDSAHIKLTVKDNGHSDFSESNREEKIENGFGIKKIISYAKRYGGKAVFANEDGFRAVVELPLETTKDA